MVMWMSFTFLFQYIICILLTRQKRCVLMGSCQSLSLRTAWQKKKTNSHKKWNHLDQEIANTKSDNDYHCALVRTFSPWNSHTRKRVRLESNHTCKIIWYFIVFASGIINHNQKWIRCGDFFFLLTLIGKCGHRIDSYDVIHSKKVHLSLNNALEMRSIFEGKVHKNEYLIRRNDWLIVNFRTNANRIRFLNVKHIIDRIYSKS